MESNDLRIFRAVALEGSITKAAQMLGYVQSNVTARIQQLEAELKTQLFYRQRGMILTPTGEKLLPYAIHILHLLDEAQKALNDSDKPTGQLAIGANHTVSSLQLPRILSEFHKAYPHVDLSLTTSSADELIYKILHFQLDGAFVKSLSFSDDNIVEELVFEENLVLISSTETDDIRTACSKPFLMNTIGCPNRVNLENWLNAEGITNIRYMEFNNLDFIIEGVIADLGVSFVPQSAIEKHEMNGLLKSFSIPPQYSTSKTFFIRHKDTLMTSALVKFIEIIESKTPYHPIAF
ncbi:MAG: LysR family transcriptional regulator [Firmicutes bacterium]|nr:LysR family transcriptional regulator [Bacillota bacterium]